MIELPAPPAWFYERLMAEPDTSPLGPAWAFLTCLADVDAAADGLRAFSWPGREDYWGDYRAAASAMDGFALRTGYRFGMDAGNGLRVALVPFERFEGGDEAAAWRDDVSLAEPELMLRMAWSETARRFLAYALDGPAGIRDSVHSVAWPYPHGVGFRDPL